MKKITLVAAIALIAASVTSCKKDYKCTCVVKDSSGATQSSVDFTINAKKSDAKSACSAKVTSQSGGYSETCSLD